MALFNLFMVFLRLGCTSFGGPVAHLGYFHEVFVTRRKWLTEKEYADLVALCQFLPGPASSQVGMAIGYRQAGQFGCLVAWLGFTLPSAILMTLLGLGLYTANSAVSLSVIQGFLIVAVVVVAHAVWGMYQKLCQTLLTRSIGFVSALTLLFFQLPYLHIVILVFSGLAAFTLLHNKTPPETTFTSSAKSGHSGWLWFAACSLLFLLLPFLALFSDNALIAIADIHYRAGALVFGGGHVVLPLLETEVVTSSGISEETFLTGYGFAQALPGPLFTFATYLGTTMAQDTPFWGAVVATISVFLPGYLLLMAALPFMHSIQSHQHLSLALFGVNAAVVGILIAAFIDPVLIKAINGIHHAFIACLGFYLLNNGKRPILEVMATIIILTLLSEWLIKAL